MAKFSPNKQAEQILTEYLASSLHEQDDKIYIHSPDTDVLFILVSFADRLLQKTMFSISPERYISVRVVLMPLGKRDQKY